MKWYERLYKGKARKFLLVAILLAAGVPGGVAVGVGGALDQAAEEVLSEAGE